MTASSVQTGAARRVTTPKRKGMRVKALRMPTRLSTSLTFRDMVRLPSLVRGRFRSFGSGTGS